jgi:hypothetical protein
MNLYSEAILKKAKDKIIVNAPSTIKSSPLTIEPSTVNVSSNVEKYYKERAKSTRMPEPSAENIKGKVAKYASGMLDFFQKYLPDHPNTGPVSGWKIEELKADYISNKLVFAIVLDDTQGEGKKWFIVFRADDSNNPIYVEIETKKFDINSFPMEMVAKLGGYDHSQVKNKATEITEKQLFDTLSQTSQKKAEELGMDIGLDVDQEEEF